MKYTARGPRWLDLVVQNKANLAYVKMRLPYVSPNEVGPIGGALGERRGDGA